MRFTFALAFKRDKAPDGLGVWEKINAGPAVIRPTTINTFEPLKRVRDVDVNEVCQGDFIWRNGRNCLGMFSAKGRKGERPTLSILLEYPKDMHGSVANEVYEFIRSNFDYRLLYGVSPSEELFAQNYDVYRFANCGAIPPDETLIIANQGCFEFFEQCS